MDRTTKFERWMCSEDVFRGCDRGMRSKDVIGGCVQRMGSRDRFRRRVNSKDESVQTMDVFRR